MSCGGHEVSLNIAVTLRTGATCSASDLRVNLTILILELYTKSQI